MSSTRRALGQLVERAGYEVRKRQTQEEAFPDFEPSFHLLHAKCAPYSMTSPERLYAVHQAVKYVSRAGVLGDIVECGVWRGGSSMMAALTLGECGDETRDVWLFDTFEGMPEPESRDVSFVGEDASEHWRETQRDDHNDWCFSPLDDVERNLASTGIPASRLHFVKGKVEDTIPEAGPERIALLRLDTDWYSSTYHEMKHFFPRIAPGGVLLIDDYGHWEGAREAVDTFLEEIGANLLLNRVDYTARIAVVPG